MLLLYLPFIELSASIWIISSKSHNSVKCISLFQLDIWVIYAKHLWTYVSNGVRIFSPFFFFQLLGQYLGHSRRSGNIYWNHIFTYQHHETLNSEGSLFVIELIWDIVPPTDKPRFSLLQLLLSPEISPSHLLGDWSLLQRKFRSIESLLNYDHPAPSVLNKAEFLSKWRHFILSNHQETTNLVSWGCSNAAFLRIPPSQKTLGAPRWMLVDRNTEVAQDGSQFVRGGRLWVMCQHIQPMRETETERETDRDRERQREREAGQEAIRLWQWRRENGWYKL